MAALLGHTRPDRQTAMCSATWPEAVRAFAATFMRDPVHVTLRADASAAPAAEGRALSAPPQGTAQGQANRGVRQVVHVVEARERVETLVRVLDDVQRQAPAEGALAIVFVNKKKEADTVGKVLHRRCVICTASGSAAPWPFVQAPGAAQGVVAAGVPPESAWGGALVVD